MTFEKKDFPFLKSRRNVVTMLMFILISAFAISSLLSGGILSQSNISSNIIIFTAIVFGYALIITTMKALGANPNKWEIIMIPTLLIGLLIFGLMTIAPEIIPEDEPKEVETVSDLDPNKITITESITTNSASENYDLTAIETIIVQKNSSQYFIIAILAAIFIVSVLIFVMIMTKNQKELPQIHLSKEVEYSKSLPKNNREIMEYYIEASLTLEKLRGTAPQWFSPTGFSNKIMLNPGPPVANYFGLLTDIYELARFSSRKMTTEDVMEAAELHDQIINWAFDKTKEIIAYE